MNKSQLTVLSAEIALIATIVLFLALHELKIAVAGVVTVGIALVIASARALPARRADDGLAVGVGTVHAIVEDQPTERQILVEVSSVHGDTFIGRLMNRDDEADLSTLRPGLVVLVAFDPAAPEELSLPDDVLAVRASGLVLA